MRLLSSVLVSFAMASSPLWAQSGANSDSGLTLQGSAEARVAPDLALVRLGVVEQAPTAEEAQDAVNGVANRIINALRATGIEEGEVQTSHLTLSQVYSRQRPDGSQSPAIIVYRPTRSPSASRRLIGLESLSMLRWGRVPTNWKVHRSNYRTIWPPGRQL